MKTAIAVITALSVLAAVASCATVASKGGVALGFLPKEMGPVPYTYFFGTLAMIFSIVTLTLLGRSWERDALPDRFIDAAKACAMIALLASSLPAMIFMSVLIQEIRKPKKPATERVRPSAHLPGPVFDPASFRP